MLEFEPCVAGGLVTKFRMARDLRVIPPYHTGAYWVDGLLIDTGGAHTAAQLLAAIRAWTVRQIVNTHSHEDHIGANACLQAHFRCPILAQEGALPVLHDPNLEPLQPYRRLVWGRPRPSQGTAIGEWVETPHHRFQVIPTPGHSPDHISLFEPDRGWLFTGDAFTGGKDTALRRGYDIYGIIASLKHMAGLPVQIVFSGSASVRDAGVQPLLDKIAYLEALGEQIASLHARGLSVRRIRRALFGKEQWITYFTLGHFSGAHLVRAFLARPATTPAEASLDVGADPATSPRGPA